MQNLSTSFKILYRNIFPIIFALMGTIKNRNGRDLTEAEDIKNRWQEYTEELYRKDLHTPWKESYDQPR